MTSVNELNAGGTGAWDDGSDVARGVCRDVVKHQGEVKMNDFYLSISTVIVVAAVGAGLLCDKPRRIFYVIIAANIALSIDAAYFVSWLATLPCLFIIAFISVIMSHPQMRASDTPDK